MRRRLKWITVVALMIFAGFTEAETTRKEQEIDPVAPALALALTRRALMPLDTFTDCRECPEMVMIPGGSFTMGSPEDEPYRNSKEGPQHRVTIEPFAMGKTEVTFTDWDACVTAGGCNGYKPPDPHENGYSRGSRPVANVSWQDAKAYVSWLSQHTGKPYRLPSESEWEYAARAGTTTLYSFGDVIKIEDANCSKNVLGTTSVSAYPPNPWGLYDMHGNVEEWVEDSWDARSTAGFYDYKGAPTDGTSSMSAVKDPTHVVSALRGGSWRSSPRLSANIPYVIPLCRAAVRHMLPQIARSDDIGFRVARTLD